MCAEKKKFILDLPLKVILTEEGTSHFLSHKKQLLNLRLADNRSAHGISMEHFSPSSVQSMILLDYISKIEIEKYINDFNIKMLDNSRFNLEMENTWLI